ncbi:MAG: 2Fe-2S iron-sulfur cluster-binding protein [Sulfitobacter sp.]
MSDRFTTFDVREVVKESDNITSFYLEPRTLLARKFVPGEYLIFEHRPENGEPIRREYSISGTRDDEIRVTIKRELAPEQGLQDGIMSTRFHDATMAGDTVKAAGPMGAFTLDRDADRPVVLLSGGVGLTPVVAMAHELAGTARETVFIHACENGQVHALGQEMRELATAHENFSTHVLYRTPIDRDQLGRDYDTAGMITQDLLEKLTPGKDVDFYLCGPGPFMAAMYDTLLAMDVDPDRISYEFFGPATVLRPKKKTVTKLNASDAPMITFAKSGVEAAWDPAEENLLEFAEENGVMIDYSCRAGTCVTCMTKVIKGSVSYSVDPFEQPKDGYALLCCCVPNGDLELDV